MVGYEDLVPNDRTIQQLKNAGAMRLIRKINVSDSIVEYDKKIKDLFKEEDGLAILFNRFMDLGEILDIEEIIKPILNKDYEELEKSKKDIIITKNKSILSKYYNQMWTYQYICRVYLKQLKEIKSQGIRLIRLLKEEYNLK